MLWSLRTPSRFGLRGSLTACVSIGVCCWRSLADNKLPTRFADIRAWCIVCSGGKEGDKLVPSFERSLKRALKGLVDRGDVLIFGGKGGQRDPGRYVTVEAFASKAEGKNGHEARQADRR